MLRHWHAFGRALGGLSYGLLAWRAQLAEALGTIVGATVGVALFALC
jgi:hypothetical protein